MIFSGILYIALGFTPLLFKRLGMPMSKEVAKIQYSAGICGVAIVAIYILTIGMDGPLRQILQVVPVLVFGLLMISWLNKELRRPTWSKKGPDKSE